MYLPVSTKYVVFSLRRRVRCGKSTPPLWCSRTQQRTIRACRISPSDVHSPTFDIDLCTLKFRIKHLPRIRSEFHIVWDRLLLRCPNMRTVTLTILNCGSTDVPWNLPRGLDSINATESLICHMMSEDSRSGEEMQLRRYDLLSLAAGLKSRHKGTYSVTASVRNIMNLTDWGSGKSSGLSYDMVGD